MGSITIGTTPTDILGANIKRLNMSVNNQSPGTQIIYLENTRKSGLTADNSGYVLAPGQSLNFVHMFDGDDIRLPWSAVASAANAKLYVKEMTDYRRV